MERDEAEASERAAKELVEKRRNEQRLERFTEVVIDGPLDEAIAEAQRMIGWSDFDGEWAFQIIGSLGERLGEVGRQAEIEPLIATIEKRHPEAFTLEVAWMVRHRLALAITEGRDLSELLATVIEAPLDELDGVLSIVGLLAWHGRSVEVRELLDELVSSAEEFEELDDEQVDALATLRLQAMIDDQLAHPGDMAPIIAAAGEFGYGEAEIHDVLARRGGTTSRGGDLAELILDFTHALHSQWGWSTARAGLAGHALESLAGEQPKGRTRRRPPGDGRLFKLADVREMLLDEEDLLEHYGAATLLALVRWPEWLIAEKLANEGDARVWRELVLAMSDEAVKRFVHWDQSMVAEVRAALAAARS